MPVFFIILKKFFHKYSELVQAAFTILGCLIIYLLGISVSYFLLKFIRQNSSSNRWQKTDNKLKVDVMY